MVQCAACYDWAHDSCIVSRLRGFRGASKLGALRQCSYLCLDVPQNATALYHALARSTKGARNCTTTVT